MATAESGPSTTVELPQSHQLLIAAAGGILGVVAGLVLPRLAGWALSLPWFPMQGLLRLIDQYVTGWLVWVLPVAGLVAGVVLGLGVVHDIARVQLSPADIIVIKGDKRQRFSRAQVTSVRIDDGHLVLRGKDDEDLIREKLDVSRDDVLAAARRYEWPLAD